ncbi:MAG: hypothetical protein EAZ60_17050 [Oscillatoriales cyanobacterium]|nr:MAG: hypothetical protein EAZ79_03670 [Oscillatoriales cyanobacterium]TAF19701.1 MAG: hypothetical protein EAZ73_14265 [Oscillatoriales cyanobacterium]TAF39092.1 MAG: hypothetical protein EAZ69_02035 [Oscillatoriales cyanobacterium]TAF54261.1 MAG: hypothetical protein EAZ60_17050 [Oscillatoriales cyanobacterium]
MHSKALPDRTHKELNPQKAHCTLLLIYQGHIHKIMQNPENKLKNFVTAPETTTKARSTSGFSLCLLPDR